MQLNQEITGDSRRYSFLREERSQFQGLKNENYIESELKVTNLTGENGVFTFKIETLFYKQSNAESVYEWVGDLHELRNEIICTLDENGRLGKVVNIDAIRNKWNGIKPEIKSKHKDEKYSSIFISGIDELLEDVDRFSDTLRFSTPYILLFPGIIHRAFKKDEIVTGYRELPNFIAARMVPIQTEEKFTELENSRYQIDVKGSIDESKFEQDKVTAMIRILKNRPRVPTQLQLQYMERYLLEDWPWSEQSMCMSLAEIPGTLYREEKNILKSI